MPSPTQETYATRATLIARLKDWGDQASWQDFFDTYWKLIYGVARKKGLSEEESHDVVQETMLAVAKQMPDFTYDREKGSFKSWLLSTTRWRISDQFRKRGPFHGDRREAEAVERRRLERIPDEAGAGQDLERLWDEEWRANLLDIANQRVRVRMAPEKYQIFDFCVNKGWAPDRVAAAFRIPAAKVYLAKHRVARMIQDEVSRLETELDRDGLAGPVARPVDDRDENDEAVTE
jgi:RNA polymerase sigma-70 factor (ECF subfamily)